MPDPFSRCKGEEDLQLHPGIFWEIARTFGPSTMDRFASRANALCSHFNSLHLDVGSSGQDAFSQDLSRDHSWANPPWTLLSHLAAFLEARPNVEAVVLAPDWPNAVWYGRLQRLSSVELLIPRHPGIFRPGNPAHPAVLPVAKQHGENKNGIFSSKHFTASSLKPFFWPLELCLACYLHLKWGS